MLISFQCFNERSVSNGHFRLILILGLKWPNFSLIQFSNGHKRSKHKMKIGDKVETIFLSSPKCFLANIVILAFGTIKTEKLIIRTVTQRYTMTSVIFLPRPGVT